MKFLQSLLLPSLARKMRAAKLTYLSPQKLRSLLAAMHEINARKIPGDVLEMGLALGGSGILLADAMGPRRFFGYDVFGMIPPPDDNDAADAHKRYEKIKSGESRGLGGDVYYGYRDDLLTAVEASFARHGQKVDNQRITLVPGLFEDTVPEHSGDAISLAHIDCDWYAPVKLCLERLGPRVSVGGLIILDDYLDYEGCRKATDAFLKHAPFKLRQTTPHAILERIA